MRDREKIDSELRLIAQRRRAIREQGGQLSSREADELLDEILAHGATASQVDAFAAWESEVTADARLWGAKPKTRGIAPRQHHSTAPRRLRLATALPLSLVAAVSAVVVMLALHRQDPSAQPEDAPPSAAPSTPVVPASPTPAINVADAAFIGALKQEGVPIPSQEYVMTQAHAVCDFLAHQPNFADAVGFVQRTSIWDANQSSDVTAGAIISYCPQSRPAGPDQISPAYQNTLSDLQAIERNLQGIQGDLRDIQGGLDEIPGHP